MASTDITTSSDFSGSEQLHFGLPLLRLRAPSIVPSSPLHISATIPFRWEEKPGVPRPCLTLNATQHEHYQQPLKCLELPPYRAFPRTPSPTSVLDAHRKFSSFRLLSGRASPDFDSLDVFLKSGRKKKGGSFRFSSPSSTSWESDETCTDYYDDKLMKKKKEKMIPQTTHLHLWGNICKGFKHAIQWKNSRKIHKESINE